MTSPGQDEENMQFWRRLFGKVDSLSDESSNVSLFQSPARAASPPPPPPPPAPSASSLQALRIAIAGKGHPSFPFLSAVYSPGSRVPCTDFTPWIVERLSARDTRAVKDLLVHLVAGNPGLDDGRSWTSELVDGVLSAPYERYVEFSDAHAFAELRAIVILFGLDGGGEKGFSLSTSRGDELAALISCQCPRWKPELVELRDRANAFIRKMRRTTPFWKEVPLFEDVTIPSRSEAEIDLIVRKLSPAARMDLFLAVGERAIKVSQFGVGGPFGRDTDFSREQLDRHGLLTIVRDESVLPGLWGKDDLLSLCGREGLPVKKSWKKDQVLRLLMDSRPNVVEARLKTHAPVSVPPDLCNQVSLIRYHSRQIKVACQLLLLA